MTKFVLVCTSLGLLLVATAEFDRAAPEANFWQWAAVVLLAYLSGVTARSIDQ